MHIFTIEIRDRYKLCPRQSVKSLSKKTNFCRRDVQYTTVTMTACILTINLNLTLTPILNYNE